MTVLREDYGVKHAIIKLPVQLENHNLQLTFYYLKEKYKTTRTFLK